MKAESSLGGNHFPSLRASLLLAALFLIALDPSFAAAGDEAGGSRAPLPVDAVADHSLKDRLDRTLPRIRAFENVEADVREGVVVLRGTTPTAAAREEVAELVSRFEGVLYVDNRVETRLEVENRLAPALAMARQFGRRALDYVPLLLIAAATVFAFWLAALLLTRWGPLRRWLKHETLLGNLVRQLLRSVVILMGLLLAMEILDLTALMGAVLGTAGLFGLALGFAFRDIVENYLAGVILSIRSPFRLKDFVSIAGDEGVITRLTTREMVLITLDGNHLRIPNNTVFRSVIRNYTRNPRRGFDFEVGVGMDEDLLRVQEVGVETLLATRGVLDDPPPSMRVEKIGDFSVTVRFLGWVDQRIADFLKVRSEGLRLVKSAFDEAGIEMPEPSRTVHLYEKEGRPREKREGRRSVREEAQRADVGLVTQLDSQIEEEIDAPGEQNLLDHRPGR